jgi:putative Holliday junction resolvase
MRTLAIDYGEKRVGLAISDELNIIAKPMSILKVSSLSDAISKIHRIIKSQGIDKVIIGLPLGPKGAETKQSIQTRYFANSLKDTNSAAIEFWNESFSTQQAEQYSSTTRSSRKKKNPDSEAARIILQEYLDTQNEPKKESLLMPQYKVSY